MSGCTATRNAKPITNGELSPFEQKIYEDNKRTNEILSNAALLSSKSLATFVRTEQALAQKTLTAEQIRQARWQRDYIPVNMEQMMQTGWGYAPEPLIALVASTAGYRVIYHNERPPITRSVIVEAKSRRLVDYLAIIDQQTEGYIDEIIPDDGQEDKVIHVYYSKF
ncbi:DotD/TraH family lipoprotein [Alteromonas sp. 14N.309.X.WAT.G.H12]|uniref:DotD/TraH family lipoprotein n=1 Tax=Alteromonas sp. 14N.309.X.WAT.G.H12 TaxID=3120824 RepID=UPI002FD43935